MERVLFMYIAMQSLAAFILKHENNDFNVLWEEWSGEYEPKEEMVPHLKKMGYLLCNVNRQDIADVPEKRYRNVIKNTLKPVIFKEKKNG